jgi:bacterioferritin-associated ferredoxin
MDPDDHVCLCFHVSLRKIANFITREQPRVASQISDCLGAGTGCQWCVPFLKKLHQLHLDGSPLDLPVSPEEYAKRRARYRSSGQRDESGEMASNETAQKAAESPRDTTGI